MSGEIYAAMAKAMSEIGSVGKTKKNTSQGYQFRGIDDVMAHVQPVLAACGIVVVPEVLTAEREMVPTKSGGSMASVRLLVKHTFYAKDGSFVVATTLGEAMDSGDKASNKAMSAALKYALTEGLLIPTYEADRDTEEASPQMGARPSPPPVQPKPAGAPHPLEVKLNEAQTIKDLETLIPALKALPEKDRGPLRDLYGKREQALRRS